MASMDFNVIVRLVDRISSPVRNISNNVDHLNARVGSATRSVSTFESVGSRLGRIAGMVGRIGAAASAVSGISIAGLGASATNVTAKYEDLGAVLETLEGSSEKAQTSLAWIKTFTKETPYELENTATAFSRLRAYGIDPMNGTLKTLGDTSAAMGKDIMDGVEMLADAVVGENERLKEFGIRGSAIKGSDMLEYSYKNKAGEQKTAQVNKNDQEAIRKTLMGIFDEKFLGSMDKRSKTFNGILANLKDTASGLQGQFMNAGPFQILKEGLQSKLDLLTRLSESGKVEQWGQRTAQFMKAAGDAAGRLSDAVSSANEKLSKFVGGWGNLGRALGIIPDAANNMKQLMGGGGLPDWLKSGGSGGGETMMSPLLEQLRTIEKGDTLWNIAKQTTGIGSKYSEIAALNGDIIKDANKIFPGQQIRVPKLSGLPDWAKAKSVATSTEQSPVQPQQQQQAAPFIAIAELAKTNKVLAAAILVRKAWDSAINFLKEKFAAFKTAASSAFNKVLDFAVANSGSIMTALSTVQSAVQNVTGTIGAWFTQNGGEIQTALSGVATKAIEKFSTALGGLSDMANDGSLTKWLDAIKIALSTVAKVAQGSMRIAFGVGGGAVKVFGDVFTKSMTHMQERLPALQAAVKNVTGTMGTWFTQNSEKIQTALSCVAIQAMEKFGQVLDGLNNQSKDGSLTTWLDAFSAKIPVIVENVVAFAQGLWAVGSAIVAAVQYLSGLLGGWGLGVVAGLLAVLSVSGATLAALFSLGQILAATGAAMASFGVFAFIGRIALMAYLLGAAALSSALPMLAGAFAAVRSAVMALSAFMMANPIIAIVAVIAAAAYLIYANWSKIVNWWNSSTLKAQVMPVITTAIDWAKQKWGQLSTWWQTTTLSQKAMDIATAPLALAKSLAMAFFNWWMTTELGQKSAQIATDAIDWARSKMQGFLDWWNGLSLKSITASIQGAMPSWMGGGGGEAKADGARASGGPVRGGGIYRVNELGPELLRQGGNTYLMADRDSNVIPLSNMVNRTKERLMGDHGQQGQGSQPRQTIPQIIDFQQRQQKAQQQEVKTSGVLNIKIDSKEPVRVTRMQSTGMQLNVHTGPMGAVS